MHIAALVLACLLGAALCVGTGFAAWNWHAQQQCIAAWNAWDAHRRAPATVAAVKRAQGIRKAVADVAHAAARHAGADAVLVGSYRSLAFQPGKSDVDIKVLVYAAADAAAVGDALVASLGFRHEHTTAEYALYRGVAPPDGLQVDVSVTTHVPGKPNPYVDMAHCGAVTPHDLALRGFLQFVVRSDPMAATHHIAIRQKR